MKVECLLCHSQDTSLYHTNEKLKYHQTFYLCHECGYVFAFPRISEEEYAAYYSGEYAHDVYALAENEESIQKAIDWRMKSSQMKIDFFADRYPQNASVLEIGSALGTFLQAMKERYNAKVQGVELSPVFVRIAKEKFGIDAYCGDVRDFFKINGKDVTYDVIIMDQVLEHLYDPLSLLELLKTKLVIGGLLYIGVPNLASPAHNKNEFFIPEHVSSFTPFSLEYLTQKAGWRMVRSALPLFSSMHFLLTQADAPVQTWEEKQDFSLYTEEKLAQGFASRPSGQKQ